MDLLIRYPFLFNGIGILVDFAIGIPAIILSVLFMDDCSLRIAFWLLISSLSLIIIRIFITGILIKSDLDYDTENQLDQNLNRRLYYIDRFVIFINIILILSGILIISFEPCNYDNSLIIIIVIMVIYQALNIIITSIRYLCSNI